MKNILLLLFVFLNIQLFSQNERKIEGDTKIDAITVYIDGAEISRSQIIDLEKGRSLIVFKNISNKLRTNSIRVSSESELSILSVSSSKNYLLEENEKPKIKILKDSVQIILNKKKALEDLKDAFSIEKEMLLKNMSLAGSNTGVLVSDLKIASDFYRAKITEINKELRKIIEKTSALYKKEIALKSQLNELNATSNKEISEIHILLSSEKKIKTNIEVKYLVSNAGWAPTYDLKVADINKEIDLTYRAQVFNNTSVDWENIKLKLSSGDPSISAESPILKTWYLNYQITMAGKGYSKFKKSEGYMQNMIVPNMVQQSNESRTEGFDDNKSEEYIEVEVSELSVEFDIADRYSIPSDNRPYFVDVADYQLPATYKHFCIPKVDRDVFLIARITGWQNLNLVEGPAHIYFAGTYVGKSYIYTRNVRDTLDLSLGRDKKVIVTRSKIKEYSSTKLIGSKRKETLAYQMIIKNNRNSNISIEIQDQIPISKISDIEVDVIQTSNAQFDENTGELSWQYSLNSGGHKEIDLQFSIKYPKNSNVQIQQSKNKMMRKF